MQSKSGRNVAVLNVQNWDSLTRAAGAGNDERNCGKNFASFCVFRFGFAVIRVLFVNDERTSVIEMRWMSDERKRERSMRKSQGFGYRFAFAPSSAVSSITCL